MARSAVRSLLSAVFLLSACGVESRPVPPSRAAVLDAEEAERLERLEEIQAEVEAEAAQVRR